MGAAVTGGVGVGLFDSFDAIARFISVDAVHEPEPAAVAAYRPVKAMFEVCYRSMLPVYTEMARR